MPNRCPERKALADAVAKAVVASPRAKKAYDAAKTKLTANTHELASALTDARKAELDATNAFDIHVKQHGC
jgi:uncharacterized membrane protein